MCDLTSDLVICKFRKSMVVHDSECPYWDQVSLNDTNPTQPIQQYTTTNAHKCSSAVRRNQQQQHNDILINVHRPVGTKNICVWWLLSHPWQECVSMVVCDCKLIVVYLPTEKTFNETTLKKKKKKCTFATIYSCYNVARATVTQNCKP